MVRLKKKMMGRKSRDMIELDLIERSLSYCPGINVSMVRDLMSWDQFEHQFMDKCVASSCDGEFDLCCPYMVHRDLQASALRYVSFFQMRPCVSITTRLKKTQHFSFLIYDTLKIDKLIKSILF